MEKPIEIDGINAMQWAREISKLPEGDFTLCFFPYSRSQGVAGDTLTVKKHCKYRIQLPQDRFSVDAENYFLLKMKTATLRCVIVFLLDTWVFLTMDINFTR